jgi:hypothetical protein
MKKIAIVLGVVLVSNMNHAFYGSQLIQNEYDQEYSNVCFLDSADNQTDEYEYQQTDEYQGNQEDNQIDIDEYDQHVCDEVSPVKISAAEALVKEMFGFVLIQYMAIRAITHAYCTEIKQALNKWFTTLIKA